uniref:Uncharacterized protein n=1 Tax=Cannabis sativa TaxID=3483 RepID=A0A803NK09_CANSA
MGGSSSISGDVVERGVVRKGFRGRDSSSAATVMGSDVGSLRRDSSKMANKKGKLKVSFNDKSGALQCGGPLWARGLIDGFHRALSKTGLIDIGFEGAWFTWCNKHKDDHSPLFMLANETCEKPQFKVRFYFETTWVDEDKCCDIFTSHWNSLTGGSIGGI